MGKFSLITFFISHAWKILSFYCIFENSNRFVRASSIRCLCIFMDKRTKRISSSEKQHFLQTFNEEEHTFTFSTRFFWFALYYAFNVTSVLRLDLLLNFRFSIQLDLYLPIYLPILILTNCFSVDNSLTSFTKIVLSYKVHTWTLKFCIQSFL